MTFVNFGEISVGPGYESVLVWDFERIYDEDFQFSSLSLEVRSHIVV